MTYRILTVCLGNICRSPAAEAVIRSMALHAGLVVEVDSAGTADYHIGDSPHTQSVEVGASRGYVVTGRGRQLRVEDFETFDLIVTMDDSNLENVLRLAPTDHKARVAPLMDFAGGGQVPDPWGKPDSAYDQMYDLIEEAAAGLIDELAGDQPSGLRHDSPN